MRVTDEDENRAVSEYERIKVDERAVLKHFEWPEKKADTLREAAFAYRDLKKLEHEISNYKDNFHIPFDLALKKMVSLSEKMERIVYNFLRSRDLLMRNCEEFHIPTDWMLDSGTLNKIKLGSVKLVKKYLRRVAIELQTKGTSEKDSSMDYMLLQGVRFAFRIHQIILLKIDSFSVAISPNSASDAKQELIYWPRGMMEMMK